MRAFINDSEVTYAARVALLVGGLDLLLDLLDALVDLGDVIVDALDLAVQGLRLALDTLPVGPLDGRLQAPKRARTDDRSTHMPPTPKSLRNRQTYSTNILNKPFKHIAGGQACNRTQQRVI